MPAKSNCHETVFGAPIRRDILARMVNWQLAKRSARYRKAKERNEICWHDSQAVPSERYRPCPSGVAQGAKPARWRYGFSARVRAILATELTKKVRQMALRTALSAKQAEGNLIILKDIALADGKTKSLIEKMGKLGWGNALIVAGASVDEGFARAAANIPNVDVLPTQGANVYDILRRERLVLTTEAVTALEERLK